MIKIIDKTKGHKENMALGLLGGKIINVYLNKDECTLYIDDGMEIRVVHFKHSNLSYI